MKSGRRSFSHSTPASQRRMIEDGDRTTIESKCLTCGQMVSPLMDKPLELDKAAEVLRDPVVRVNGKVANQPPSNPIDLAGLMQLAQHLYAHALTLQELLWSEGEVTYEAVRPKYDRQAAQQFKILHHVLEQPPAFGKRGARLWGQASQRIRT